MWRTDASQWLAATRSGARKVRHAIARSHVRAPLRVAANRCIVRVILFSVFASVGCRQQMAQQPSHRPLTPSKFFRDERSARPLVEGTIPRGTLAETHEFATGKADGSAGPVSAAAMLGLAASGPLAMLGVANKADPYVDDFPVPIDAKLLARGKDRYEIFCAMCHDRTGYGKGMIVQRGYAPPPSYHIPRLRNARSGYIFDVVTRGFGAMPSYSAQIPPKDRWAITAYVRVLQYSQNAQMDDVPEAKKAELAKERSR